MRELVIKNLGRMKYVLGIEVAHSQNGVIVSQEKYILDLLAEIGFVNYQPEKTLIEVNHILNLNKDEHQADRGG